MLKKYSQVFKGLFFLMDLVVIFGCWVLAYFLRFYAKLVPIIGSIPDFSSHLSLALFILPVYALVFKFMGLYEPMRIRRIGWEGVNIFKASSLALFIIIFLIYFVKKGLLYSRLTFLFFWVLNILALDIFRSSIRWILKQLRRRGYNLRHILIVGTGDLAREVAQKIREHLEFGFNIVGFVGKEPQLIGRSKDGISIVGTYKELKTIIEGKGIDQVIFALSAKEERMTRFLLGYIDDVGVDIRVVPDLGPFYTLRKGIEELDGLPVISLRESPLYGWSSLAKRLLDIVICLLVIIILSPLMCLITIFIKFSSSGSIFYTQERTGLDGEIFRMIKFRTMKSDAERKTGPVWAKENDARRTRIGSILRRFSLDELPQFFNVLAGEMSLVGPRPERPVFVKEFRKHIPQYVLRHKIRAGITGWAQIHGWRGNTSLEKRIEYDLYYIEYWSVWLDLQILLWTIPAVLNAKGAH